jgi:hypothetical protein
MSCLHPLAGPTGLNAHLRLALHNQKSSYKSSFEYGVSLSVYLSMVLLNDTKILTHALHIGLITMTTVITRHATKMLMQFWLCNNQVVFLFLFFPSNGFNLFGAQVSQKKKSLSFPSHSPQKLLWKNWTTQLWSQRMLLNIRRTLWPGKKKLSIKSKVI